MRALPDRESKTRWLAELLLTLLQGYEAGDLLVFVLLDSGTRTPRMSSDVQLSGECDSSQSADINEINNREREGHTLNDLVQVEDEQDDEEDILDILRPRASCRWARRARR